MLALRHLEEEERDWARLDALPDRLVSQTSEWLDFLADTQAAEPVVAEVLDNDRGLGYFTGCVTRRVGVRILGSPMRGWSTGPMGFNLVEEPDRRELLEALARYAFNTLGCLHVELMDPHLDPSDAEGRNARTGAHLSFAIDLTQTEDELLAAMSSSCRRAIRKGQKEGVTIEEAGTSRFADEYYDQLEEVFAKQGQRPLYSRGRVRSLLECLLPSGRVLCLRAVAPSGERVATGIFPGTQALAHYWGGASWRRYQHLRPNEALMWAAIRILRERGAQRLDLGGGGTGEGFRRYKEKWGPIPVVTVSVRESRFRLVGAGRDLAAAILTRGR